MNSEGNPKQPRCYASQSIPWDMMKRVHVSQAWADFFWVGGFRLPKKEVKDEKNKI